MNTISVAELRQNPTAALEAVEAGESFVLTRHRRPIARLVPIDPEPVVVTPARHPGRSKLVDRPRDDMRTYEETEALLHEMASDW